MQVRSKAPIKVFLVDDHRTVLWGLEKLIESADAPKMSVVGTAENCDDMFSKLPLAEPDVLLLDLDLGGVSSLTQLGKIQQHTAAQVLILTGSNDPAAHQQAVVRGARGVIHKQAASDVLLRAIERVHEGEIWLDHTSLGNVITALSRSRQEPDPEAAKWAELTAKERQIVTALVEAKAARNHVIAELLHMSEHTLRNHLTAIYSKLEVAGRMELYLYATTQQHRLVAQ